MSYYSRVTTLALFFGFLTSIAAVAQTPVAFTGPLAYLGKSPAIADFNGDGIPDLATIDQSSSLIHIHSGIGNGGFTGDRVIDLSMADGNATNLQLATADVNLDGLPDLIVPIYTSTGTYSIVVLLGKAGGGFSSPAFSPSLVQPANIYLADVNGDGKPDIIQLNGGTLASVSLGNGDGYFQKPLAVFKQPFPTPTLAFGDLNGDGKLDLAIPVVNGIFILFGDGTGHFPTGTTFFIDETLGPIVAADVNGDGKQDLVTETAEKGLVEVFLGDGHGGFGNPAVYFLGRPGAGPALQLAVADVNGDGIPDIVTPDPAVLLGKGDGTFGIPTLFQTSPYWVSVQLSDLARTGRLDIVGSVTNDVSTAVILNSGGGQYQSGEVVRLGNGSSCLAVADFNRDGHDDVAVGVSTTVAILLGTGQPNPALQLASTIPLTKRYSACPLAADFNNDGVPDLLVKEANRGFSFLAGLGDGTFAPPITNGPGLFPLDIGDFNGDGVLDVAGRYNSDIVVLTGDGSGMFTPYASFKELQPPTSLAAGDLNGDGLADLVSISTAGGNQLTVYLNSGGGVFTSQQFPLPGSPFQPEFAILSDANKDGILDLVVVGLFQTYVFLGQGNGSFTQVSELSTGGLSGAVGDLNGDAFPDLVITDGVIAKVFLGDGSGNFSFPGNPDGSWYAPADTNSVALGFLQSQSHSSGLADLITLGASAQGAAISVLINRSVAP